MPGGIFPIRGEELRNWLRTDFRGIFTSGLSGAESLRALRDFGVEIRTQDFYAIRREVIAQYEREQAFQEQIEDYESNALIPAAWHSTTHGLNLRTQFLYRVRVTGFDMLTGEPVERIFSVGSDDQLTVGQVKSTITSELVTDPQHYQTEIEDIDLISCMARPDSWE